MVVRYLDACISKDATAYLKSMRGCTSSVVFFTSNSTCPESPSSVENSSFQWPSGSV